MGCDDNVETALAQLKTTMPMDVRHCQMVMGQSATLQPLSVERIRVVAARRWLGAPRTAIP